MFGTEFEIRSCPVGEKSFLEQTEHSQVPEGLGGSQAGGPRDAGLVLCDVRAPARPARPACQATARTPALSFGDSGVLRAVENSELRQELCHFASVPRASPPAICDLP